MTDLYPLKFSPEFQYRLWGGRELGKIMDAPLPEGPIGEAWILSDRADFSSKVAEGPLAGQTLTQLMQSHRDAIMGDRPDKFGRFPLLLKFLDVQKMLSVQVHPQDDKLDLLPAGEQGKTEAWMVLGASPGARIYAGLKPGTSEANLRVLTNENADVYLASFAPQVGQAVLVDAGTVHSIGDGVVVFEVQQNSDMTFRLYDWNHVDAKTGKLRDLQVEQALACVDFETGPILPQVPTLDSEAPALIESLLESAYFEVKRVTVDTPHAFGKFGEPKILVCGSGAGSFRMGANAIAVGRGEVILLPAAIGPQQFTPESETMFFEIAIPGQR